MGVLREIPKPDRVISRAGQKTGQEMHQNQGFRGCRGSGFGLWGCFRVSRWAVYAAAAQRETIGADPYLFFRPFKQQHNPGTTFIEP